MPIILEVFYSSSILFLRAYQSSSILFLRAYQSCAIGNIIMSGFIPKIACVDSFLEGIPILEYREYYMMSGFFSQGHTNLFETSIHNKINISIEKIILELF